MKSFRITKGTPMKILAVHAGHDAAAALYEDYERIAVHKEERLTRVKQDGRQLPLLSLQKIGEIVDFKEIDLFLYNGFLFNYKHLRHWNWLKRMQYKYFRNDEKLLKEITDFIGLREDVETFQYNHHFAHAIPTLFYSKKWENALLYTADGGGDHDYYSIHYFDGKTLTPLYEDLPSERKDELNSIGQMYSYVTKALGFKANRHEGKITGLAAYGKPSLASEEIRKQYYIDENGFIRSHFKNGNDIRTFIFDLAKKVSREDLSFAAQIVLEDVMTESVKKLGERFGFTNIGLSGGVFANVKLNQRISELDFIEDMFVFPPMGDEGLVIGGVFEYLIAKNGFDDFLAHCVDGMEVPYWGEFFDVTRKEIPEAFSIVADENIVEKSVELLKNNKICAIFTQAMEYGPRALGARSIIINPGDKSINDIVNKRLDRTEFMPFAPYVRKERVHDVFIFPESSLRAMKYMTVTCDVKEEWQEKIQATVHVDNTARPQTIVREDNPLYYDILHRFEEETGIPCLVNTSFNAHEEPIINTFEEALNALKHDRIDYLITDHFIIGNK